MSQESKHGKVHNEAWTTIKSLAYGEQLFWFTAKTNKANMGANKVGCNGAHVK